MTEEEAKSKWCPHVRSYQGGWNVGSTDRVPKQALCIGSRCMAWRWVQDELTNFVANGKTVVTPSEHGYCGLAGKL